MNVTRTLLLIIAALAPIATAVGQQTNIVIDSSALTVSVNGVASPNSFRGVPFTVTAYNGRTRFLFAGDMILGTNDRLTGVGSNAITFIVSGDVTIPDGAVIDVSALTNRPGPGGGVGGGTAPGGVGPSSGGGFGTRGTGGGGGGGGANGYVVIGIPDRLYNPTAGGSGNPGNDNATAGALGLTGDRGRDGASGYNAPNTGGAGQQVINRGFGGGRGSRAYQFAGGGSRGTTRVASPSPGGNGNNATVSAGNGGSPGAAGSGAAGFPGLVRRNISEITGGGGGAGGQGGGSGGGGGGGGGGAGGGGGGGGGGDYFTAGHDGAGGQRGGHGGAGGRGGDGGIGGSGGHGGGAFEIVSYGWMQVAGSIRATGAPGQAGLPGQTGFNGAGSESGYTPGRNTAADHGNFSGGDGGAGTRGGTGGKGGDGGAGGPGAGGAGGSIKLFASVLDTAGSEIDVRGGTGGGPGADDGDVGRLIFGANTVGFTGTVLGTGALENYPGPRALNAHLSDFAETPYILDLVGGSDIAGLLNGLNAGSFPNVLSNAPTGARLALHRMATGTAGYDHDFPGYDLLVYINLTCEPVSRPVLGAGAANYAARFRDGGLTKNPVFGGTGASIKETLEPWGVYVTLVPESAANFTFGFAPESTLVFKTEPAFAAGATSYLTHTTDTCPGGPPTPIVQSDPVITLPPAGPVVNFDFDGELQVNIEPAAATTAGAGWSVAGQTPIFLSGTTATGLPTGPQTLTFTRVPGWLPPRDLTVTILPNQGAPTTIDVAYVEAPTFAVSNIAPQSVRSGEVLAFWLAPGTTVQVVSGAPEGSVLIQADGWFSYEPAPQDRLPFEVRFTLGGVIHTVLITPQPDLPPEQAIIALQPVAQPPDPANRDYSLLHKGAGDTAMPVNFQPNPRVVTISGKRVVFDANGDTQFYDAVHDQKNIQRLNIYAEEVIIRSPLKLQQTDVTIYARDLRFEDGTSGTASIDTTPVDRSAINGSGAGLDGGNITLRVANIISDPSASARLILHGGNSTTGAGGNSGLLSAPFAGIADFAEIRGGAGTGAFGVARAPVILGPAADVPASYQWVHPIGVRSVLLYAKDLYYLGFISDAGAILREYETLLKTVAGFNALPAMPDADHPALEFAELRSEISGLNSRIADNLDYFGHPAGWVPMLSFEANFILTDAAIERAMRTLYLSYWLTRSEEYLTADKAALEATRDQLGDENDALKDEFPSLMTEIDSLEDQESAIDSSLTELKQELLDIEARLNQRAAENVEDRNNIPFWKRALRTTGTIMQMVPIYQPALGAVGGGLDLTARVDEQDPLTTVLEAATIAGEYKAAQMRADAQAIDAELNPPAPRSDKELERDELLSTADNIEAGLSVANSAAEKIREFFASNEAPKDEIDAELAKIQAADPQFNGVVQKVSALMEQKELYVRRLTSLQNRINELPGLVLKNRLAMQQLSATIEDRGEVLDPQALSVVKEAEARARDRLRKHFYMLARSFEYRLLEPYRAQANQAYDPVDVFDEILVILQAAQSGGSPNTVPGQPHLLSPAGFDTLASVFEEELSKLSDRIIARYENGEIESTFTYPLTLSAALLPGLNEPEGQAILNLYGLGFLPPNEEGHRMADLRVTNIVFDLTQGGVPVDPAMAGLLSAVVDIEFVHSGLSRLTRGGQTYLFNHFRDGDPSRNPIKWTAKLNLLTGAVGMVRPSLANQSLLATLLGQSGELGVLNFSRPAAWADVYVRVRNLNITRVPGSPGGPGFGINIRNLNLQFDLDYYSRTGGREVDIRVVGTDGLPLDIKPRLWFDTLTGEALTSTTGRRDAVGPAIRSFDLPTVVATAESFYGNPLTAGQTLPAGFAFTQWLDQSLNPIGISGTDRLLSAAQPNALRISNTGYKRFYAVYEYVGDKTLPVIESIALDTQNPQAGTVEYLVTFTENVVGVDTTDFSVNYGDPGVGILGVSGSGKTRRVLVSTAGSDGSLLLAFFDNDSVLDLGGNSVGGYGESNGDAASVPANVTVLATLMPGSLTPSGFVLTLHGNNGETHIIETSENLQTWETLGNVTITAGNAVSFTDPDPRPARFYRARLLQDENP
jgi:predicted nuclease with TOPRIM domain